MANKDLSLYSKKISLTAWWYEERGGIEIYYQALGETQILVGKIPWRSIRQALQRKDK